jgi:hypothetical protein
MSVAPKIAVTTDSVLVEQEPSRETRRRLRERKNGPDGLDSKDAEGGAALGDPTSMRSWLSCLDIVKKFLQINKLGRERERAYRTFKFLEIVKPSNFFIMNR